MLDRFEEFIFLINKISKDINKIKTKKFKKYSLNGSEMEFIYYLGKYAKLTFKEFCKYLNHDKAYISRSVNKLKQKNMIKEIEEDNQMLYALTSNGQNVYDESVEITAALCKYVYLDDDKKEIFYNNLKGISERIENIVEKIKNDFR